MRLTSENKGEIREKDHSSAGTYTDDACRNSLKYYFFIFMLQKKKMCLNKFQFKRYIRCFQQYTKSSNIYAFF